MSDCGCGCGRGCCCCGQVEVEVAQTHKHANGKHAADSPVRGELLSCWLLYWIVMGIRDWFVTKCERSLADASDGLRPRSASGVFHFVRCVVRYGSCGVCTCCVLYMVKSTHEKQ